MEMEVCLTAPLCLLVPFCEPRVAAQTGGRCNTALPSHLPSPPGAAVGTERGATGNWPSEAAVADETGQDKGKRVHISPSTIEGSSHHDLLDPLQQLGLGNGGWADFTILHTVIQSCSTQRNTRHDGVESFNCLLSL